MINELKSGLKIEAIFNVLSSHPIAKNSSLTFVFHMGRIGLTLDLSDHSKR